MAIINYGTRVVFDFGAIETLDAELALLGIARPLLVTDRGLVATGLVDRIKAAIGARGVALYDGTPQNPTEAAARAAAALAKDHGADGVIGLGGGSSMDLAKAAGLLASHDGPLAPYAMIEGGIARIGDAVPPIVTIPTTAGTGSEVGRGGVIIMDDGRKLVVVSPHVTPKLAICDPDLTVGLPPGLTAATGMDAFAHCVETFIAPADNPPAEAIALDGFQHVVGHIARAVADGDDREARWHMMMGAMEGAMAFQKGLGAVHGMSHPLGSITSVVLHHGTLNAVCLPAVLRFNAGHVGDKYRRLLAAWGKPADADFAAEVAALNASLGLPASLAAMGVEEAMIGPLIPQAMADHTTATNPRPLSEADYAALFAEAMRGE